MTAIEQVRTLIQDQYKFDSAVFYGDGAATVFSIPNWPIRSGMYSLYLNGSLSTNYTLDLNTGVLVLNSALGNGLQGNLQYHYSLFTDDQIQLFLDLESNDVKGAAACALESMAANQAMVLKVIKLLDLQTDGSKVASSLLEVAQRLRDESGDWAGFDIAVQADDYTFTFRDHLVKQIISEEV